MDGSSSSGLMVGSLAHFPMFAGFAQPPKATSSMAQPQSWSSLFGSSTSSKLQYYEPVISNGKRKVCISKETHDLGFALWENYLVGQFFGNSPRLSLIQAVGVKG